MRLQANQSQIAFARAVIGSGGLVRLSRYAIRAIGIDVFTNGKRHHKYVRAVKARRRWRIEECGADDANAVRLMMPSGMLYLPALHKALPVGERAEFMWRNGGLEVTL